MPNEAEIKTPEETAAEDISKFKGFSVLDGQVVEDKPAATDKKASKAAAEQSEDDEDGDEDEAPVEVKPKRSPQERINKAVASQRAAERERDAATASVKALMDRLDALEKGVLPKTETKPKVDPDAPDPADFTYGELDAQYLRAVARYETKKTLEEDRAATKAKETEAENTKSKKFYEDRLANITKLGSAKYDDFQETVIDAASAGEFPLGRQMTAMVFESDFGHDIAYILANDLELAKKVDAMTPAKQAVWFGRQEAKLEDEASETQDEDEEDEPAPKRQALPSRKVSQAPAPLRYKGKGGGGNTGTSPDTPDFAKFEAMATAAQRRK